MKKLGTYVAIVALVVGGGLAAFWPSNHFRLYDANLQPLAMTEAEAYCVGEIGISSNFKTNDPDVKTCITESDKGTEPSIASTPRWFCEGLVTQWPGSVSDCIGILDGYDLWPLLEGGLTFEWSEAHPRPTNIQVIIEQPERAGERDNSSRGSGIAPMTNDKESEESNE